MTGQTLYDGAPKEICELLNGMSQQVSHTCFTALKREDQLSLCEALLAAMRS